MQLEYNKHHNIIPKTIIKEVRDKIEITMAAEEEEYETKLLTQADRETHQRPGEGNEGSGSCLEF